ncbi:hypothetical protein ABK040_010269 [Willaertia magna]
MIEINTSREVQKTLALIKPDAVAAGYEDEILERVVDEGFTIVRSDKITLTTEKAQLFYKEHEGKEFFPKLVEYMTSGPIVVVVLAKYNAVQAWRDLIGPTDVDLAKKQFPTSIRALYGKSKTYNAVHGSSDIVSAIREVRFFYPNMSVDSIPTSTEAEAFIKEHLESFLTTGLTKLAKEKPENPTLWLANWIIQNNPNKPQIQETFEVEEQD